MSATPSQTYRVVNGTPDTDAAALTHGSLYRAALRATCLLACMHARMRACPCLVVVAAGTSEWSGRSRETACARPSRSCRKSLRYALTPHNTGGRVRARPCVIARVCYRFCDTKHKHDAIYSAHPQRSHTRTHTQTHNTHHTHTHPHTRTPHHTYTHTNTHTHIGTTCQLSSQEPTRLRHALREVQLASEKLIDAHSTDREALMKRLKIYRGF
jgi:hypothetical protein